METLGNSQGEAESRGSGGHGGFVCRVFLADGSSLVKYPLHNPTSPQSALSSHFLSSPFKVDSHRTIFSHPAFGATTQLLAISVPELKGKGDTYLEDVSASPRTEQARDPKVVERLRSRGFAIGLRLRLRTLQGGHQVSVLRNPAWLRLPADEARVVIYTGDLRIHGDVPKRCQPKQHLGPIQDDAICADGIANIFKARKSLHLIHKHRRAQGGHSLPIASHVQHRAPQAPCQ
ncbi:hypothetical protein BC936DRAFT_139001 [Jimgerdemannia flammicorona]|uniref:Uncharacterized protein n=1 Tax=Jimgerdemannia flammicorona TaxID=994334 RepID=A0A433BAW2_9FUNG|nr:hypothetical protein BC936DRAFT_139001 [Jimgerdemannia flammicorona]